MTTTARQDPLTCFCFKVTLDSIAGPDRAEMYFKSVSGLKYESEVVEYKEGGYNVGARRFVGPAKWSNLVLKKGFTGTQSLLEWRRLWLEDSTSGRLTRATGTITQLKSNFEAVCSWKFLNGWPCKWELSDYDASKSELAIETLEIAHEGLTFTSGS